MAKEQEKQKAPEKESNPVYQLASYAAAGTITMQEAKRRLREWVKKQEYDVLDPEIRQELFKEAEKVTRQLQLSAEALGQEFSTIVAGL